MALSIPGKISPTEDEARIIIQMASRLPQFRDGNFQFHWDEDPFGGKGNTYITFRDYRYQEVRRYHIDELRRMVNMPDPYNPYKLREDSDPLMSPFLRGEVGKIEGVSFVESSDDNFIVNEGGKIEKRIGSDDMTEKFKEIDAKIKMDWGK